MKPLRVGASASEPLSFALGGNAMGPLWLGTSAIEPLSFVAVSGGIAIEPQPITSSLHTHYQPINNPLSTKPLPTHYQPHY